MTSKDTSQFGFCKNSLRKLQDITHQVNNSIGSGKSGKSIIRLQDARLYITAGEKELLFLDFYPELRDLAWGWEGELCAIPLSELDRSLLKATQHPFILYLKAHFVGHVLRHLRLEAGSLNFEFEDGRSFLMDWEAKQWLFRVPGRKDYGQRLPQWASLGKLLKKSPEESPSEETAPAASDERFAKLRINVEQDLAAAREWLTENGPAIEFFFQNPALWGAPLAEIPRAWHEWIKAQKISFQAKDRKASLEKIKKLRDRFTRKVEKAQARLDELQPSAPKAPQASQGEKGPARASLGKRFEIAPGLEAILGRKAEENDQLYRAAQSRDLWFHVRGQKGSHVWIKRGQKGFGAKDELDAKILEKAALIAAKNSKASGAWIAVDYTERRFLKKPKGAAAGAVLVLQSKTIFVSLDGT